jgi:hypothetical protein
MGNDSRPHCGWRNRHAHQRTRDVGPVCLALDGDQPGACQSAKGVQCQSSGRTGAGLSQEEIDHHTTGVIIQDLEHASLPISHRRPRYHLCGALRHQA